MSGGTVRPLYATSIHNTAAGGDLQQMKGLLAEAEAWLKEYGNVSAAIEVLKTEIAKLEVKR
jgi:hypothetical protein